MIDSELKYIWSVPKYLPYVQPELTAELLEQAQKQIGYSLPEKLVEILNIQNGGYMRYKLAESPHRQIFGIGPYFPSLTDFDWTEYKEYVSFELDGLVPIDGDGHWYICLDYSVLSDENLISEVMEKLRSHNMKIKPISALI